MARRKTICLDFDGVLHAYTSGWQDVHIVGDGPVDGAMDFLVGAIALYNVAVYSSRSVAPGGRSAMKAAIYKWLIDAEYSESDAFAITDAISFPISKPPAWVTIDDRAIAFDGNFPSFEEIDRFVPWYKKDKKDR